MTLGSKVFGVRYINKRGFERKEECPNVIVATGGLSYPATGSTGDGYAFASDLGHSVEPVRPSLTPLVSSHPQIKYLDGLLLRNVRATLWIDDQPVREEFGELGFSQRGIEGAVALRMSRDAVDALIDQRRVKLVVDLKPALTEEVLRERIAREIADMEPTEFFTELLRKLVPKPLVLTLVHEMDVNGKNYVSKITEEQIGRLIKTLKGFTFPLTDYAPFEYAVVTAGGVCCDEVNPYTMESLKVRGLYFAGEVLDLDANTGGYNLQIAFSTGRLAGMLKKIGEMRIGGRTIGLGFYGRIAELHNRLVRARYFRGHGVHSPFVYNIVRGGFHARRAAAGRPAAVPGAARCRSARTPGDTVAKRGDSLRLRYVWPESCGCRILYPDAGPATCGDAGTGRGRG